ncbi:hypothetical protein CEXT_598881 [Caerostris extrusa]|uniref:Uncharacterized protein n=1 Tax=Caerostris extrusa TaxID=172846 RepID=A0AAV4MYZ3_CAEEX|nr:hypothetical protein CEXT_598881 [Caerostris extrusa]
MLKNWISVNIKNQPPNFHLRSRYSCVHIVFSYLIGGSRSSDPWRPDAFNSSGFGELWEMLRTVWHRTYKNKCSLGSHFKACHMPYRLQGNRDLCY